MKLVENVATALTACGIETHLNLLLGSINLLLAIVATALTACGIETLETEDPEG